MGFSGSYRAVLLYCVFIFGSFKTNTDTIQVTDIRGKVAVTQEVEIETKKEI